MCIIQSEIIFPLVAVKKRRKNSVFMDQGTCFRGVL